MSKIYKNIFILMLAAASFGLAAYGPEWIKNKPIAYNKDLSTFADSYESTVSEPSLDALNEEYEPVQDGEVNNNNNKVKTLPYNNDYMNGMGTFSEILIPINVYKYDLIPADPNKLEYVNSWEIDPATGIFNNLSEDPYEAMEIANLQAFFGGNPPMSDIAGREGFIDLISGGNPDWFHMFQLTGEAYGPNGAILLWFSVGDAGFMPILVDANAISIYQADDYAGGYINIDGTVEIYTELPVWITALYMD